MKYIGIPEDKIPSCCAQCFALDDDDYCCCRITNDQKRLYFDKYSERMDSCPLKLIDTYKIFMSGVHAAYRYKEKKEKERK